MVCFLLFGGIGGFVSGGVFVIVGVMVISFWVFRFGL